MRRGAVRGFRGGYASAYASALVAAMLVAVFAESDARAGEPTLTASMQCERAAEPGRVRCSVEARVEGGRTIGWADVAILQLPDFASPLKGRLGPTDTVAREAASSKWAFGVVAKRAGQGEARARVRAVVCEPVPDASPPRCVPLAIDVRTTLQVGG